MLIDAVRAYFYVITLVPCIFAFVLCTQNKLKIVKHSVKLHIGTLILKYTTESLALLIVGLYFLYCLVTLHGELN